MEVYIPPIQHPPTPSTRQLTKLNKALHSKGCLALNLRWQPNECALVGTWLDALRQASQPGAHSPRRPAVWREDSGRVTHGARNLFCQPFDAGASADGMCSEQAEQPGWCMRIDHNRVWPCRGGHSEATRRLARVGHHCAATPPGGDGGPGGERVWGEDYHQRDSPSNRVHLSEHDVFLDAAPHPAGWSLRSVPRSALTTRAIDYRSGW